MRTRKSWVRETWRNLAMAVVDWFPNSCWSADLIRRQSQAPSSWLQTPALLVLPQSYRLTFRCLYTLKLPIHTNHKHRPQSNNHIPHHSIDTRHHCWNSKTHTPRYRHNRPRHFRYLLSQYQERHVLDRRLEVFIGRSDWTVWLSFDDSIAKSFEER